MQNLLKFRKICTFFEKSIAVDKRTPGTRMAETALRLAYGQTGTETSPRLMHMARQGNRVTLCFSADLKPLTGELSSLLVNGKAPEKAVIQGNTLTVFASEDCAIAYAQENAPQACLFGQNGWPVFPFTV